jgi:hypothetical protein
MAEIRGTNLPALFAGAPPRVVLPDGKGELTLEYSATTGSISTTVSGKTRLNLRRTIPTATTGSCCRTRRSTA